jgi:tetratricopeptide (TPR) repeat protein
MTKKEIYKKLKTLETDEEKYSYLKELSEKAGMLSPETRKAFYETLGDYALKLDKLSDAFKAYEQAGSKEGLIKVGDKLVEKGRLDDAAWVYEQAGSKEGLIKVGDKCVEKGWLDWAVEAYEKAGEEKKSNGVEKENSYMKK